MIYCTRKVPRGFFKDVYHMKKSRCFWKKFKKKPMTIMSHWLHWSAKPFDKVSNSLQHWMMCGRLPEPVKNDNSLERKSMYHHKRTLYRRQSNSLQTSSSSTVGLIAPSQTMEHRSWETTSSTFVKKIRSRSTWHLSIIRRQRTNLKMPMGEF